MIVENGEIIEQANSYVDIDFADNYFSARSESEWDNLSDNEKEVLLIKGTDFIDNIFDFQGKRKTKEQCLEFPRINLIDNSGYEVEGIPNKLKQAVCVASLMLLKGDELFVTSESNGAVTSERIGAIAFTYDTSKVVKDSTLYQQINTLLRGFYKDKSGQKLVTGRVQRV